MPVPLRRARPYGCLPASFAGGLAITAGLAIVMVLGYARRSSVVTAALPCFIASLWQQLRKSLCLGEVGVPDAMSERPISFDLTDWTGAHRSSKLVYYRSAQEAAAQQLIDTGSAISQTLERELR